MLVEGSGGSCGFPPTLLDPRDLLVMKAIAYLPSSPVQGTVDKLRESTPGNPVLVRVDLGDPRKKGMC